jgi:hypothetical protein
VYVCVSVPVCVCVSVEIQQKEKGKDFCFLKQQAQVLNSQYGPHYSTMIINWEEENTSLELPCCTDPRSAKFRLPFCSALIYMLILSTWSLFFCYPSSPIHCHATLSHSLCQCPGSLGISKSASLILKFSPFLSNSPH